VAHTVDTTGLHKRMTHDGLGRLVKVEEGRPSDELATDCPIPPSTAVASAAPHTTGEYTYDAADRLKSFTYEADGVPVTVAYTYDLAGRQTEVHRTVTGEDPLHWRTFEFDGGYPVRMYKGTSTGEPLATASSTADGCAVTLDANYATENDHLAVSWTWDELGRVIQKWVRSPDGGYDCYDVTWDTSFPGARTRSTDPTGYTEWLYADIVGDAGNLGLPSTATRTWTDTGGDPRTASFDYDYDLAGNVIVKMFPSGVQVDTTRSNGWVTAEQVTLADDQVYINLYPTWDDRGYATGYEVYDPQPQLRGVLSIERTSPTQVDQTTWMAVDSYTVNYDWMGAGALLTGKTFGDKLASAVDADSVSYGYDELNRVVEVDLGGQNASAAPEETYAYDPMGHLIQAELTPVNATSTVWDYTWGEQQLGPITWGAQRFGPSSRSSGSTVERFHYDDMGRLATTQRDSVLTTYTYEGTGQLVRVDDGTEDLSFAHDIDDNLVWRKTGSGTREYWFDAHQIDDHNGTERMVETVLPALQVIDGLEPKWIGRELDGHGIITLDRYGMLQGAEVLGAYGVPIAELSGNDSLEMNGFQGMERDSGMDATRMGVRHMASDGRWLQPEPFLAFGLMDPQLLLPRATVGVYAMGNPNSWSDRSGYEPQWEPSRVSKYFNGEDQEVIDYGTGHPGRTVCMT